MEAAGDPESILYRSDNPVKEYLLSKLDGTKGFDDEVDGRYSAEAGTTQKAGAIIGE